MNNLTTNDQALGIEAARIAATETNADREIFEHVKAAVDAAEEKSAGLGSSPGKITSFTDYFIICSGNSVRQVQAIADAITGQLKTRGKRPMQIEGYTNGEWILIDYGTFVVHVFTAASRRFYDLERLWRDAERVEV